MKPCKHGKLCKIKNCPLKHVAEEELEECQFYKQGFCCNGPKCARRHKKRLPEECPVEATFDTHINFSGATQFGKKIKTAQPNDNFKVTLCTHWLQSISCPFNEDCHYAHGEEEVNEGYQPNSDFLQDSDIYDPTANRMDAPLELPFTNLSTAKISYFILQSPDLRSLSIARQRGVWAVPMRMSAEINASFRSSDHVIFFFSVRPLRGIYGVARLTNLIPQSANPASPLTPEFPIMWLRSLRLSIRTVAQVKLGASGMFVGRCASDGRFDSKIGQDMLLTTFRKPSWNWHDELDRAHMNIRLKDISGNSASSSAEYYPMSGALPYYLPRDVLFAQDWIDRAALTPSEKMSGGGAGYNKFDRSGGGKYQQQQQLSAQNMLSAVEFYTGDLPGFVVCAASPVVEEMFRRSVFGLPPQMQDVTIHGNVPLFVFDSQALVMLGIFYADSPVGVNIDPAAFVTWGGVGPGGGSPLPVQFKFRIALECPPISLMDPELVTALGGGNAMGAIGVKETRAIANLFARRSPAFSNQKGISGKSSGAGSMTGSSAGSSVYKPPFKFNANVPIEIVGSLYDIKKKLLGTNASTIIQLVDEMGSKNSIRIRMRGIGSGFMEGQSEIQEPLMFSVSAESDLLLQAVVARVKQLIDKARGELQMKFN
mmetsp:Transcript_12538/g.17210  ORF Transcript_12538/g.17210 Transcript_12538/m.17210 type:complete len:653 (-) Transcript_12538:41-1999(-)